MTACFTASTSWSVTTPLPSEAPLHSATEALPVGKSTTCLFAAGWEFASSSLTVTVAPVVPPIGSLDGETLTDDPAAEAGLSLSAIVTVTTEVFSVACVGFETVSLKDSGFSTAVSSVSSMRTVLSVWPGAKTRVPVMPV